MTVPTTAITGTTASNRNYVKVDRYAVQDLAREHHLSASDAHLLFVLVMEADFRSWEVKATYGDLAESATMGRKTVERGIGRFEELGLVTILRPFGPHRAGTVFVDAYRLIVVPGRNTARGTTAQVLERTASIDAFHPETNRVQIASQSRPNRVVIASTDAVQQGTVLLARDRGIEGWRERPTRASFGELRARANW